MTGAELKSIREAYGLSASAMGRVLGYSGPKANVGEGFGFVHQQLHC
jgi:hypothetical protein